MSGVSKAASAGVSIAYNAILIVAKLAAAIVTGSVAILSEALNSSVDLVASVIAFVAVKRADEPADEEHPYGHEKMESVAAAIEGMLIIGGATYIVVESIGRLSRGDTEVESIGIGIAVIAFSAVSATVVSAFLRRQARVHDSPALAGDAAHLGADAITSFGVLGAPGPRRADGRRGAGRRHRDRALGVHRLHRLQHHPQGGGDPGRRVAAARGDGPDRGGDRRDPPGRGRRVPQAPSPGRRAPPLHRHARAVQEGHVPRARALAGPHLRDAIESRIDDAEVLIHVEPETSRQDPADSPEQYRAG